MVYYALTFEILRRQKICRNFSFPFFSLKNSFKQIIAVLIHYKKYSSFLWLSIYFLLMVAFRKSTFGAIMVKETKFTCTYPLLKFTHYGLQNMCSWFRFLRQFL